MILVNSSSEVLEGQIDQSKNPVTLIQIMSLGFKMSEVIDGQLRGVQFG
jgi:hypothetical protein